MPFSSATKLDRTDWDARDGDKRLRGGSGGGTRTTGLGMTGNMGYTARRAVWVGKIAATWLFVVAMMSLAATLIAKL
jgi:hypothetical protein